VDFKKLFRTLIERAKERSTWLGLVGLATAFGVAFSPEQVEAISAAGVAVAGLIAVITKDPKPPAAA